VILLVAPPFSNSLISLPVLFSIFLFWISVDVIPSASALVLAGIRPVLFPFFFFCFFSVVLLCPFWVFRPSFYISFYVLACVRGATVSPPYFLFLWLVFSSTPPSSTLFSGLRIATVVGGNFPERNGRPLSQRLWAYFRAPLERRRPLFKH